MEEYNAELSDDSPPIFDTAAAPVKHKDNQLALLMKDMEVKAGTSHYEDDLMSFVTSQPIIIDCTPLQWWCRLEQRQRCPRLSRMAIAILSSQKGLSLALAGHAHGIGYGSHVLISRW
jgi:hypothetical protein